MVSSRLSFFKIDGIALLYFLREVFAAKLHKSDQADTFLLEMIQRCHEVKSFNQEHTAHSKYYQKNEKPNTNAYVDV